MFPYASDSNNRIIPATKALPHERYKCLYCGTGLFVKTRGRTSFFSHFPNAPHQSYCPLSNDKDDKVCVGLEDVTPERFRKSIMGKNQSTNSSIHPEYANPFLATPCMTNAEKMKTVSSLQDIVMAGLAYAPDFMYAPDRSFHDLVFNFHTAKVCLRDSINQEIGYRCIVCKPNFSFYSLQIIRFQVYWPSDDHTYQNIFFDLYFPNQKDFFNYRNECFHSYENKHVSKFKCILIYGDFRKYDPIYTTRAQHCKGYYYAEFKKKKQIYLPEFDYFQI